MHPERLQLPDFWRQVGQFLIDVTKLFLAIALNSRKVLEFFLKKTAGCAMAG
jgi:hypothetical protein